MDTTRLASTVLPATPDAGSTGRRPSSLHEVAAQGAALGDIDAFLREFLDAYYIEQDPAQRAAMLADEPQRLESERANAYLAGVAEHLARCDRLPQPLWADHPQRFLHRPFFPAGLESLKATLLVDSPTAFRRRLVFVGADPLFRPRKAGRGFGSS